MIDGGVEAGPNAVLALKREGYHRLSFSPRDVLRMMGYRGFWRMAWKYGGTGMTELYRSFSKRAFHRALWPMLALMIALGVTMALWLRPPPPDPPAAALEKPR